MPLDDLPQAIQFIIFLALFVLLGIYPAWKKTARLIRDALRKAKTAEDTAPTTPSEPDEQQLHAQLNDFEIFILRRLAGESQKALSRRKINAELHLELPMLKAALKSLQHRGLIRVSVGNLRGLRFSLSSSGRSYAIEKGFIPRIHR